MSKCSTCIYGFIGGFGSWGCEYINVTGELRGCPAGDACIRYVSKKTAKRKPAPIPMKHRKKYKEDNTMAKAKLSVEEKRNIVTANSAGATVKSLAEQYKVGKSTIYNIIMAYNEHGERAFEAQEAQDKLYSEENFEREKSEIANDEPCYCVTADTDIDAYMADREKEPATAATETGSEQEISTDIPADIIPDIPEDVKPPHGFSPMAADAVWRKIEDLREEAAELMCGEAAFERIIADCKEKIRCLDDQLINVEAEIDILMGDYEAMTGGRS